MGTRALCAGGKRQLCAGGKFKKQCACNYLRLVPCEGWDIEGMPSAGGVIDWYIPIEELETYEINEPIVARVPNSASGEVAGVSWCYTVDPDGECVNAIPEGAQETTLAGVDDPPDLDGVECGWIEYQVGSHYRSHQFASDFIGHEGETYCDCVVTGGGGLTTVTFSGAGPHAEMHQRVQRDGVEVHNTTTNGGNLFASSPATVGLQTSVAVNDYASAVETTAHTYIFEYDDASSCPPGQILAGDLTVQNFGCKALCVKFTWPDGEGTYWVMPNETRVFAGFLVGLGGGAVTVEITPGECPP